MDLKVTSVNWADSLVLLVLLFPGHFLVSKLLVVLVAVAFVAQALGIAHPIGVLTSSGSGFSAV